jgi:hypothetical protein
MDSLVLLLIPKYLFVLFILSLQMHFLVPFFVLQLLILLFHFALPFSCMQMFIAHFFKSHSKVFIIFFLPLKFKNYLKQLQVIDIFALDVFLFYS